MDPRDLFHQTLPAKWKDACAQHLAKNSLFSFTNILLSFCAEFWLIPCSKKLFNLCIRKFLEKMLMKSAVVVNFTIILRGAFGFKLCPQLNMEKYSPSLQTFFLKALLKRLRKLTIKTKRLSRLKLLSFDNVND